jgi:YesN/AraC family two-component response regulator
MITVVIADDQPLVRSGLKMILTTEPVPPSPESLSWP